MVFSHGQLYREDGGRVVPALDHPEVRQALSDYAAVAGDVTALLNTDEYVGISVKEVLDRVAQGEVGMTIMNLGTIMDHLEQYPGIAVAPLPPGDTFAHYGVYPMSELAISAGTAQPQAAWRWVHFVSRQNLGQHLGRGDLPARRSVAELSGVWDQLSPEVAQVIRSSLENQAGRSHFGLVAVSPIYRAATTALVNVLEEQMDVGTALDNAQQEALIEIHAGQERRNSVTPVPFSVSAPSSPEKATIEFQVSSHSHEQLYRAAARAFEDEYPERHVKVSLLGAGLPESCLVTYVDGSALTAALTWSQLAELDPLAEAQWFSSDGFFPQAIAAVTWQGNLYAVPGTIKPLVLYYNPDIFQGAGLEPPTSDWTVEDVLATAAQIEAAGQGSFGYLPQGNDIPFLLEQQGISLFTNDRPPRPQFTASEILQSLQRLQNLGGGQVAFPIPSSEMIHLLKGGRVGMWFNTFAQLPGIEWPAGTGVTAIQLRPGTPLPLQVGALGMVAGVQYPQRCWDWINYLSQQGVSPQDELPALRSLAESETTRQTLGDELFAAYTEALRRDEGTSTRDTIVEDWATWWFTQALREARTVNLNVALQTAQNKAETFVTCLGPAGAQDLAQAQKCAQQADPDHPLAHLTP